MASDPCVLTNGAKDVFVLMFVDDFQFTGANSKAIKELIKKISLQFKITDLGNAQTYLGLQICRDRSKQLLFMHQQAYITKVLNQYQLTQAVLAPILMTSVLTSNDGPIDQVLRGKYQAIISSLRFLANRTRSNILFTVGYLGLQL